MQEDKLETAFANSFVVTFPSHPDNVSQPISCRRRATDEGGVAHRCGPAEDLVRIPSDIYFASDMG